MPTYIVCSLQQLQKLFTILQPTLHQKVLRWKLGKTKELNNGNKNKEYNNAKKNEIFMKLKR